MVKLSLQSISRKVISFDVSPTTTFAEIEKLLNENDNFKGFNFKFIYKGKVIDPNDNVQSINYDPSSLVTVAFHPASAKPKRLNDQTNSEQQNFDEKTMEKIETICALGYDQAEVVEALKKFNFDAEKAKNYICYRLDNESNQKIADLFSTNHNEAMKICINYLEQTDPELAKKVYENPIPMYIMLGVAKKRTYEEDYDGYPYFY